jgi:hypothetical protein
MTYHPYFEDKILTRTNSDKLNFAIHGTSMLLRYSSIKYLSLALFVENSVNVVKKHKEQDDIFCIGSVDHNDRIKKGVYSWECIIYLRYKRAISNKYAYRLFDFQGYHPEFLKIAGNSVIWGTKFVVKYLSPDILDNPDKFKFIFYCNNMNKFKEIRKKF